MRDLIDLNFGIGTKHFINEFHEKEKNLNWVIMCFHTPFVYEFNGRMLRGEVGECLINSPGKHMKHGPVEGAAEGFRNDWIILGGTEVHQLVEKYNLPIDKSFPTDNPYFITEYLKRIAFERINRNFGYKDKISLIINEMLLDLARAAKCTDVETIKTDPIFENLRNEMFYHPENKWNIEEMAKLTGYSVSHFCYLYKKQYGCSPFVDLQQIRIIKAKSLLMYTSYNVSQIAELCGFSSINYFINVFSKTVGDTPLRFRKKSKGN